MEGINRRGRLFIAPVVGQDFYECRLYRALDFYFDNDKRPTLPLSLFLAHTPARSRNVYADLFRYRPSRQSCLCSKFSKGMAQLCTSSCLGLQHSCRLGLCRTQFCHLFLRISLSVARQLQVITIFTLCDQTSERPTTQCKHVSSVSNEANTISLSALSPLSLCLYPSLFRSYNSTTGTVVGATRAHY